jgi:hypothetical protein
MMRFLKMTAASAVAGLLMVSSASALPPADAETGIVGGPAIWYRVTTVNVLITVPPGIRTDSQFTESMGTRACDTLDSKTIAASYIPNSALLIIMAKTKEGIRYNVRAKCGMTNNVW